MTLQVHSEGDGLALELNHVLLISVAVTLFLELTFVSLLVRQLFESRSMRYICYWGNLTLKMQFDKDSPL